MEMILEFLRDVLSQPALLIGIMSCVGLIALKRPFHKIMTGTLKPILGYLMLAAGAGGTAGALCHASGAAFCCPLWLAGSV